LKLYMLFSCMYGSFCLTNIVCHFLPPFHRARGLSDEWATSEPTGNGGRYLLDKIMTVQSNETFDSLLC
jgi:hypothetical protein